MQPVLRGSRRVEAKSPVGALPPYLAKKQRSESFINHHFIPGLTRGTAEKNTNAQLSVVVLNGSTLIGAVTLFQITSSLSQSV